MAVILYVFLNLWRAVYDQSEGDRVGGYTIVQMLWYLAVTEAIMMSTHGTAAVIDHDVRTGSVAVQLLRPLSYPLYRLWTSMGERLVRFTLNMVVGAAVATVFVGPLGLTQETVAMFGFAIAGAFVLDFLGYCLIGLGAFWMENTAGIALIYARAVMLLGGMMIPLDLFPDPIRDILEALPFASILYGPARLFVSPDPGFFLDLIVSQAVAIAVLSAAVVMVYRSGLRRIHANGG